MAAAASAGSVIFNHVQLYSYPSALKAHGPVKVLELEDVKTEWTELSKKLQTGLIEKHLVRLDAGNGRVTQVNLKNASFVNIRDLQASARLVEEVTFTIYMPGCPIAEIRIPKALTKAYCDQILADCNNPEGDISNEVLTLSNELDHHMHLIHKEMTAIVVHTASRPALTKKAGIAECHITAVDGREIKFLATQQQMWKIAQEVEHGINHAKETEEATGTLPEVVVLDNAYDIKVFFNIDKIGSIAYTNFREFSESSDPSSRVGQKHEISDDDDYYPPAATGHSDSLQRKGRRPDPNA
jgi:hypothetical protein